MLFHIAVDQFFIPVIEVGVAPLLRSAFFSLFSVFYFILLKRSMFVYSILNLNQWVFFLHLLKLACQGRAAIFHLSLLPQQHNR